jgi:cytochrome c peroxidase
MFGRHGAFWILIGVLAGCGGAAPSEDAVVGATQSDLSARGGEAIFDHVTFEGNGRTCSTCHTDRSAGALSPEEVQARYAEDPTDPLFRSLDSDDGVGNDYSRLLADATIRINVALPDFLSLADEPGARSVTVNRAIPTVKNIALDPVLMSDGREPSLESQAAGAIRDHFQATETPSRNQLRQLARYEKSQFSSWRLFFYSLGAPAPKLPQGRTASEQRGRAFFLPDGACGMCHGGPMLNEMTEYSFFGPPGSRFADVMVSEFNEGNQPVHTYHATFPDGSVFEFPFADPGRLLQTSDPMDLGAFKITTLWGVRKTAPYFHDNSAKTLTQVVDHYAAMFEQNDFILTDQDKADIVAYMRLL